ncbi:MAG: chemotaxis protein CheW [Angelakisella sp.]
MDEQNSLDIASIAQMEPSAEMDGKYLTFFTGKQLFGVPICDVVQIVGIQVITEVPEFPQYAKGIINLRGTIIPVIDVRLRFGMAEKPYDEHTCIIVTLIHDVAIGFIVDSVDSVTDIESENICPPPKVSSDYTGSYLTGIAKHMGKVVLLMDTQKLLSDELVSSLVTQAS